MFAEVIIVVMSRKHNVSRLTRKSTAQGTRIPPIQPLQGDLAAVFEAMTDGVNVYDKYGQILHMNRAYRTLIGLDTLPMHRQLTPEERSTQLQLRDEQGNPLSEEQRPVHRILAGETLTDESMMDIMVHTLDGHELQLNVTGAPPTTQMGLFKEACLSSAT